MKREIKVKGRPIGKMGLWVYGIGAYKTNTAEHLIINAKGESIEVVNLCWWTGLKDKNGREIYEGDIVENGGYYNIIGVVCYDTKHAHYFILNEASGESMDFVEISSSEVEVIGNIHDNTELKGGDK